MPVHMIYRHMRNKYCTVHVIKLLPSENRKFQNEVSTNRKKIQVHQKSANFVIHHHKIVLEKILKICTDAQVRNGRPEVEV